MWADKEALIVGLLLSAIFVLLCSLNIEAQGLHLDEAQDGVASFVLLGKDVSLFTSLKWHRIPLLTVPYVGAIKSIIYGLYLKLSNRPFTITSWRLLGILFVALGLFLFCVLTYRKLGRTGILLFFGLILADTTVLLRTRHDCGPTALALSLRLLWLALWFRREFGKVTLANTFLLGMITGVSIYDKQSSIVLIFPLLIILLMNKAQRTIKHWLLSITGIIIGSFPLILINLWSFVKDGYIFSLRYKNDYAIMMNSLYIGSNFLGHLFGIGKFKRFLSLGNGIYVRGWVLGNKAFLSFELWECVFISIIGLSIIINGILHWKKNFLLRTATLMILCYLTIWITLGLLPLKTGSHHWIVGTPFQYLGIALFWLGFNKARSTFNRFSRFISYLFVIATVLLLLLRLPILASTQASLIKGEASFGWDISYTEIARFASSHHQDSLFLTPSGGIEPQIYCLSNGRDNLVYNLRLVWDYSGLEGIRQIISDNGSKKLYLVLDRDYSDDKIATLIIKHIEEMSELQEEPLEPELKNLKILEIIKYRFSPG